MRSFQQKAGEFEKRGLRIATISVDPPETNHGHRQALGLTFPMLSDEKAETIRRYDLLHVKGHDGTDISRPAEFLVDSTGTVRWVNLTESAAVRTLPDEVLKAFDSLPPPRP